MVVFLEGLNLSRRKNVAKLLGRDCCVFTAGIVFLKLEKEKGVDIDFDYYDSMESLESMDNITFFLNDNSQESKRYEKAFEDFVLPRVNINIEAKTTDEEIAKEILEYVGTAIS